MGYDPTLIQERQVTTPLVDIEITTNEIIRLRLQLARDRSQLEYRQTSPRFKQQIQKVSQQTGDAGRLSDVDVELLSIALELHNQGHSVVIISDDYSIQNVATQLQIDYVSLSTLGIRYQFQWVNYCPGCYRRYPANTSLTHCDICGTELKKKPKKIKVARRERLSG